MSKRVLRIFGMVAITSAGVAALVLATHPADKDYISYWSSGQLLLHHANPYSRAGVLALERSVGYVGSAPLIMRNPPWALFLTMPLGLCSPMAGLFLWTLAAVACVVTAAWLLGFPRSEYTMAILFAPALAAISAGQSSPSLLLGFALFLRFQDSRPLLGGAGLLLMAVKPHLFLIFWAVLLADCVYRRGAWLLTGLVAALAVASATATIVDGQIWGQYAAMIRGAAIDHEFIPTASTALRIAINRRVAWIALLPSATALCWGLAFYLRGRRSWKWSRQGMLVILVTVLVSPYAWFPDEIVLLPAIAFALMQSVRRKYSLELLVGINCLLLALLLVFRVPLTTSAYIWSSGAWLGWFLYATSRGRVETGVGVEAVS